MNSSTQAGMAIKTIVGLLVGLALASVRFAEAQQQQISGKQTGLYLSQSEPDVGVSE
jgi:hypothetical protein